MSFSSLEPRFEIICKIQLTIFLPSSKEDYAKLDAKIPKSNRNLDFDQLWMA
jgi:hypothetical protein